MDSLDLKTNSPEETRRIAGALAGLLEEGDIIEIDIPNHSINAKVSDETFAERKKRYVQPEAKVQTGYLARYAKLVSGANKGAVMP